MLEKLRLFEQTSLGIIQGAKVPFLANNAWLRHVYDQLSGRMHAAHFISAEPQTYVTRAEYLDTPSKFMGKTWLHPISTALHQQAETLRFTAKQKQRPVTQFEMFGLNWKKRQATQGGVDFEADAGHIPVLARADHVAFTQAMNMVRRRYENPSVKYAVPIILQNSDHFWEVAFETGALDWVSDKETLKRLNVHFSSGRAETIDLLATLPFGQKIAPDKLDINLGVAPRHPDPHLAFSTTDLLKFDQTAEGHKDVSANGLLRRLLEIVGPFQSPTEESYSYEGNAEDEKFRAIYDLFKKLGTPAVRKFFSDHGYEDLSRTEIVSHDGGLGFCMENAKGERRIDLFTAKYFPNSVHKLNSMQMSPGVELAYLKRTDGLEVTMDRLHARVREIVAEDPRFSVDDLRAYDTSLFVSAPLQAMLDAIDRGDAYDPVALGMVTVFDAQTLRVSEKPQFPLSYKSRIAETEHYLIPEGQTVARSLIPDWVLTGPNVTSYKLLRQYMGASNDLDEIKPEVSRGRSRKLTRMGLLATPEMVAGKRASDAFQDVKGALLRQHGISTQLGPNVWHAYKESPAWTFAAAAWETNPRYLAGMKNLLNRGSVLYVGKPDAPLTEEQKVTAYLFILRAMERNQVFNRTEIVAEREAVTDVLKILEYKQMLGLVGQQTRHLLTVADGRQDAIEKIADIVRKGIPQVTPVHRHFYSDGQVENHECMTMTVYLSASNCNKEALDNVWRVGYLAKMNGFNLKTGGGNDGQMKAINDGFLAAEEELAAKGHFFPNQMINVQCVDTEAIEKPYLDGGIYRCHPDFESREADLQKADFSAALYGGIGTDVEELGWMKSVLDGMIDPARHQLCKMNAQMDSPRGPVGVHDIYREIFSDSFLRRVGVTWAVGPEGVIDQACAVRDGRRNEYRMDVEDLRDNLRDEMARAANPAMTRNFFRPPYGYFFGQPGEVPPAPQQGMTTERKNTLA